jgi:hypothetical protein
MDVVLPIRRALATPLRERVGKPAADHKRHTAVHAPSVERIAES